MAEKANRSVMIYTPNLDSYMLHDDLPLPLTLFEPLALLVLAFGCI